MPSQLLQKHFTAEVKGIDPEGKRVTGVLASSGSLDRDEEIILPEAWSIDAFKRNPIFLFAHASRSADPQNILGRVENVQKTTAGLVADFAYDTDINPKAAMVFAQVQRGTLRAYSVGFVPKAWVTEYSPREQIDALPETARKALESGKAYVVYTNVELIEISQVPVPSNPDAMIASVKSARLAELKQLEEQMNKDNKPAEAAAELKPGPDIEAIVKAAVQPLVDQVAALTEQVTKMATPAPAPEETPAADPAPAVKAAETIAKLAALPPAELVALMSKMTEQEREAVKGLLATAKTAQ